MRINQNPVLPAEYTITKWPEIFPLASGDTYLGDISTNSDVDRWELSLMVC